MQDYSPNPVLCQLLVCLRQVRDFHSGGIPLLRRIHLGGWRWRRDRRVTEVDFRNEWRAFSGRLILGKDVVPQNSGERQADVNSYAGRAMAVQPYHMASCRYFHRLYYSFARQAPVPFPLLSPVSLRRGKGVRLIPSRASKKGSLRQMYVLKRRLPRTWHGLSGPWWVRSLT